MAVVATAVVHAAEAADMTMLALFEDGQSVHVGAQPDTSGSLAAAKHADDAGPTYALMNLEAEFAQCRRDDSGRAVLGERQLRVCMQVTPKFDQVRQQVGHLGQGGCG